MSLGAAEAFGIALMALWGTAGAVALGRSVAKSPAARELAAAVRKMNLAAKGVLVAGLVGLVAVGGTKPGGTNDPPRGLRSPPATVAVEPSFAPVEVRTNNVALRAESASAVEMEDWRKHGSSSGGVWLDFDEPVFRIGTNPVFRAHVAASGAVSFDSMRRPPVGAPLPDGTGLPALAPLLAPLGMVPEANWTNAGAASRFWHDAAPGRGRVLTWEEALLDRQPGRRVSVQAELLPSGDFTYRYDFADALDPPATNLVIGGQIGTNGVNALAILGSNTLAATVWRVDGARVANGVSIADLLCTNGVLRTPARFAIEWKNTTGIDPNADTDGDGLSDGNEVFLYGTDPRCEDTDGDGLSDMAEILAGANPLDADENGDGVPDGITPADWASHPLWATNAIAPFAITITLNGAVSSGASASLLVDGLCIPLRNPASWSFGLIPGELHSYRLFVEGDSQVDLSVSPADHDPNSGAFPFWTEGTGGVFDGPSNGGGGNMAIPLLSLEWVNDGTGSHEESGNVCLHEPADEAEFCYAILPAAVNRIPDAITLDQFTRRGSSLFLPLSENGGYVSGSVEFRSGLRWGHLFETRSAHRCHATAENPYCQGCGHYLPIDLLLYLSKNVLTLKHDNQVFMSISHHDTGNASVTGSSIRIRRLGETNWQVLSSSNSVSWTARIAGYFEVQGSMIISGTEAYTAIENLEVQFPAYHEIVSDSGFVSQANSVWQRVLNHCVETNRHESGFWVRLNTETDQYIHAGIIDGPGVSDLQGAFCPLGLRPADNPAGSPSPLEAGAVYSVASFHCHTPTTYRTVGRDLGPSEADEDGDRSNQVTGIVYDYQESHPGTNWIPPGWPKTSEHRFYRTPGLLRRPTPQ